MTGDALRMLRPGDSLGRFRLLRTLGQGGMASVFLAREEGPLERLVACKVLLPHLREDPDYVRMFLAEAQVTAGIAHPNVVAVFEAAVAAGVPFIAMEPLDGLPLSQVLEAQGALPLPVALATLWQIAAALEAAHGARSLQGEWLGLVHRDVSPQNVFLGRTGHVKLLDFGIADWKERQRLTQTGELRGKLAYLAPEQITRAVPVTAQADLWALGVVAHECLTGENPFRAQDESTTLWRITTLAVPPSRSFLAAGPVEVAAALDACLQRDPELRPDASSLLATLGPALPAPPTQLVRQFMAQVAPAPATPEALPSTRTRPTSGTAAEGVRPRGSQRRLTPAAFLALVTLLALAGTATWRWWPPRGQTAQAPAPPAETPRRREDPPPTSPQASSAQVPPAQTFADGADAAMAPLPKTRPRPPPRRRAPTPTEDPLVDNPYTPPAPGPPRPGL